MKREADKVVARLQSYQDWTGERAPSGEEFIKAHTTINNDCIGRSQGASRRDGYY